MVGCLNMENKKIKLLIGHEAPVYSVEISTD